MILTNFFPIQNNIVDFFFISTLVLESLLILIAKEFQESIELFRSY